MRNNKYTLGILLACGMYVLTMAMAQAATPAALQAAIEQQRLTGQSNHSEWCALQPTAQLEAATTLATDTLGTLRHMAAELAACALQQEPSAKLSRQAATVLSRLVADPYEPAAYAAAQTLAGVPARHIDTEARAALLDALQQGATPPQGATLRLVGRLQLTQAIPALYQVVGNRAMGELRWDAMLALARMGDTLAIQSCMTKIRKRGIGDALVYHILPDLVYMRRPEAVAYMVEVMQSEEPLCSSPNPDHEEPILCGYRIMEQLPGLLKGFPLKTLPSGDIDTDDYPKALRQARQWCAQQQGRYRIMEQD